MKTALITGATGQDASYLAQLLLEKGYAVYGTIRRSSSWNTSRIDHLHDPDERRESTIKTMYADMTDACSIARVFDKVQPDEVYHLAAQSHVRVSFDTPDYTTDVIALGTTRMLEEIRSNGLTKRIRFYNAGSSEMFGSAPAPQNEQTPFQPRSPYACAKVHAFWMTKNYRDGYGLHASTGILFNHEGPRRGETFVTRKVTKAVARIVCGKQKKLHLGLLDAKRDWGLSAEYVVAMWKMLQQEAPDDYVIGTGETHSVQEFVERAFSLVGLDWRDYVSFDAKYGRPTEVYVLQADPRKAFMKLGWRATIGFDQLVRLMVTADLEAERGQS